MKLEITDWNPTNAKVLLGRRNLIKTNCVSSIHYSLNAGDRLGAKAEIRLLHLPLKADVKILDILDDELDIPTILW